MRSLIIGYGSTGKSFERYLEKESIKFDIYDEDKSKLSDKKNTLDDIKSNKVLEYTKLYISPGIDLRRYLSSKIISKLDYETDLDIFFKENQSIKIGVTGTNGKSTLVHYLNQALNHVSSSVALGNIGNPLLDNINHKNKYSVIEASSFQLEKMKDNNFDFSFITNIQNDHIDFHKNFENYKNAKLKICSEMGQTVFCQNDSYREIAMNFASKVESVKLSGDIVFTNLPYRLQTISKGIINDSKSTNSASLLYALKKLNFKGNLIICGDPNKEKYKNLEITQPKRIFIYGHHKKELSNLISHSNISTHNSLHEIFEILCDEEDRHDLLFSPGNPSGNDYANYIERGDHFNKLKAEYLD